MASQTAAPTGAPGRGCVTTPHAGFTRMRPSEGQGCPVTATRQPWALGRVPLLPGTATPSKPSSLLAHRENGDREDPLLTRQWGWAWEDGLYSANREESASPAPRRCPGFRGSGRPRAPPRGPGPTAPDSFRFPVGFANEASERPAGPPPSCGGTETPWQQAGCLRGHRERGLRRPTPLRGRPELQSPACLAGGALAPGRLRGSHSLFQHTFIQAASQAPDTQRWPRRQAPRSGNP